MGTMSRGELLDVLLQRRFFSLAFTPIYDLAIDGLLDEASKACAREILREEYGSGGQPTHREDLVHDLLVLGATRQQILASAPSSTTIRLLERLFDTFRKQEEEHFYQLKILTTLRLAGEVLVAIEYERLWPHLRRFGLSASDEPGGTYSRFYYPHMCHDARRRRFADQGNPLKPLTHSDRLTDCVKNRLVKVPRDGVQRCLSAGAAAYDIKAAFYDQFLDDVSPYPATT
jgi:hypothetical protein